MKSIFITEQGQVATSDPVNVLEVINMTSNAILNTFTDVLKQIPEDVQQKAREEFYDMYNTAASALLKVLDPQAELHPDITEQAILEAENRILDEQVSNINGGESPLAQTGYADSTQDKTNKVTGTITSTPSKGIFDQHQHELAQTIKAEMIKDGLIPLDCLDENGDIVKPIHVKSNVTQFTARDSATGTIKEDEPIG